MTIKIVQVPARIRTAIELPYSKSISNRLLIISALSGNMIKAGNVSDSDDTQTMIRLLRSGDNNLDAGHAGTTMRFLTAYFAAGDREVLLTGSERMKNRPIGELVSGLRALGADIEYFQKEGFPPLKIRGKQLNGGKIFMQSGISSQYISAILMIAPYLNGGLELELTGETFSFSYISMTLDLMKQAGAKVKQEKNRITVGQTPYKEGVLNAEPDWSSASYWFMVAGLHPDAEIMLKGLGQNSSQGDSLIARIFDNLGIHSEFTTEGLKIRRSDICLPEFRFDFRNNPDMVQSFVPYCVARGIPFYFSGCKTLRIKETDRVFALYQELGKFGVEISYSEDGDQIWWDGTTKPDWQRKVSVSTYKDHRMALGMAPLSIKTGELVIEDPMVVTKSYPSFWKDFENAGFTLSR